MIGRRVSNTIASTFATAIGLLASDWVMTKSHQRLIQHGHFDSPTARRWTYPAIWAVGGATVAYRRDLIGSFGKGAALAAIMRISATALSQFTNPS